MSRRNIVLIGLAVIALGLGLYFFSGSTPEKVPESEHVGEEDHAAPDTAEITQEAAAKAGIASETVNPGTVRETITLTGRITLNQKSTGQIKARFAGIVREVKKGQGDTVKAGDVLAIVESNDSLQLYPVKSPLDGTIISLNTNVGDVAGDASLFTVADISDIWADFHIFPRDIDRIKSGQQVIVTSFEGNHTDTAPIAVVLPVAEASSQTIVARVVLPNEEGLWHSGMTVRGDVAVNEKQVPLAIKTSALQRMEGKTVVFVQTGNRYAMRPVTIGLSDPEWTEVREGLKAGEAYVSKNSFMIKADIGKAGAEHED